MDPSADAAFMRRALQLARLGFGTVHPNPIVGAVVVRDGTVVGEGFHEQFGGPHAEIHALRAAGSAADGATLYVTLEPCAHFGKTPPCTDAIIAAGIRRVVFAVSDPSRPAHGGAALLRQAGVDVESGVEHDAARALNPGFLHQHEHATLYVAAKLAMSLDARIGMSGMRTRITGDAARQEAHRMRASHDAILIGSATALIDDPLLTVRGLHTAHKPVRVVVDTEARLPLSSALVTSAAETPLWILCAHDAPDDRMTALARSAATVIPCDRADDRLDLQVALRALHTRGIHSVLVEGGSAMFNALLRANALHRLHLFVAPLVLGGHGVPAFTSPLPEAWQCVEVQRFDADALLTLTPRGES